MLGFASAPPSATRFVITLPRQQFFTFLFGCFLHATLTRCAADELASGILPLRDQPSK